MTTDDCSSCIKYTIKSDIVCDGTAIFFAELEQYVLDSVDRFAQSNNMLVYITARTVTTEIIDPPDKSKPYINCKFTYKVEFILYK